MKHAPLNLKSLLCALSILISLPFGLFCQPGDCQDPQSYPPQPEALSSHFKKLGIENVNIFQYSRAQCEHISQLHSFEKLAVPQGQGWSRCTDCYYDNHGFKIATISSKSNETEEHSINPSMGMADLTWSLWGEFFHHFHNDRYYASVMNIDEILLDKTPFYVISRPVYVLPIITFHPGHILVDLLQQVFSSMMKTYGMIRKDSLILLDVANRSERDVLLEKIIEYVYNEENDMYGQILSQLSDLPLFPAHIFFHEIKSRDFRIHFKDIHFGLDISNTFFNYGHNLRPCIMTRSGNKIVETLSSSYQEFRRFILKGLGIPFDRSDTSERKLTLIQRHKSRTIENIDLLIREVERNGFSPEVAYLEDMGFKSQLQLFQTTDVLVATAGSALHNLIFMRPHTFVIILMQPGWCEWSWMYANQAVLLDIRHKVYCEPINVDIEYFLTPGQSKFHWTANFWQQGPRMTKDVDITVNVTKFSLLLKELEEPFHHIADCHHLSSEKVARPHNSKVSPVFHVYVSSITSESNMTTLGDSPRWNMKIMGEVTSPNTTGNSADWLFSAFPHLSICIDVVLSNEESAPICFNIQSWNYYSNLIISTPEVNYLHLWAQTSEFGGKIAGSDVFFQLDMRVSPVDGGFSTLDALNLSSTESRCAKMLNLSVNVTDMEGDHPELLSIRWTSPQSIQRGIADFCFSHRLDKNSCGTLSAHVANTAYKIKLADKFNLPEMQLVPTPQNPFIFVHIEKTGGTTLREFIYESTMAKGLDYFIPCHGNTHCVTFGIDESSVEGLEKLRNVSVIAGHFEWNEWKKLPAVQGRKTAPPCLLIGRHPVSRAISYFYERHFHPKTNPRMLNEYSAEELISLGTTMRGGEIGEDNATIYIIDEGIEDAYCRVLSNQRATTGLKMGGPVQLPERLDRDAYSVAEATMSQCVVGILEHWNDSKQIIQHWFPWISFSRDSNRRKMKLYSGMENLSNIKPALRKVLEDLNSCDMKLHETMLARFRKEKETILSKAFL
jgi:hypothetical protein